MNKYLLRGLTFYVGSNYYKCDNLPYDDNGCTLLPEGKAV